MSTIRLGKVVGVPPNSPNGIAITSGVGSPKNAQSKFKARFVQVRVGPAVYIVQLIPQAGEDVSPCNGSLVAILESAGIRLGVAIQDNVPPSVALNQGEREIYGSDGSGGKLGRHKFKQNGKQFLGNSGGDLCTQLDALLTALNTFSGTAAQGAITTGGSSAAALAAAINALLAPLFTAVVNCKTAIDAILDTSE